MNLSALRSRFTLLVVLLCLVAANALAQGAPGNLTDMPSVERIKAEIKGSDPTDTLARQLAIFTYLQTIIDRIKYNRTVRGPYTTEESNLRAAYSLAAYQINQDYAKSHSPAEVQAFGHLEGKYEFDSAFYKDWSTRLIGKQATATYNNTLGEMGSRQQAHYNQEMDQYKKDTAAQQEANRQISGNGAGLSQDPTAVATRRCLELGGSSIACMGKGFGAGMMDLIGFNPSDLTGPGNAGIVLQGFFKNPGTTTTLDFGSGSVTIGGCGKLVADGHAYTLEKRPGGVRVVVNNEPAPITLTLRPDGGLVGPGPVDVKGRIIIGYHTVTETLYVDGAPAVGSTYGCLNSTNTCQRTTSVPDYAPKIERCPISSYAPPPPPQRQSPQQEAAQSNGLMGMLTGALDTGELKWPIPPGLRMTGQYGGGRLLMDFSPASVILDCGEAHVRLPYTVENAPDRFLVHIENTSSPITLAVEPDNSLRGSGSTTVNGRLVSGMQGENVTFRPHPETCDVDNFRPKTGSHSTTSTKIASNNPAPAPGNASVTPAASAGYAPRAEASTTPASVPASPAATMAPTRAAMRVIITSAFSSGTNPTAGQTIYVMRERMDDVLRKLGAPIPATATPAQAWAAFATACSGIDCGPVLTALKSHFVTAAKLDANGKTTLSAQATTGAYYLFAAVRTPGGSLIWDVPANFVAGDNTITLTDQNAELIH